MDMQTRLMKTKDSKEAGFTLIEVLIAAVITVFGFLTMASFSGSLVSQNTSNERETMAVLIAEEKLESLRIDAFLADLTDADSDSDTVTREGGTFTRTWVIIEDSVLTADEITVSVAWDGPGDSQISLATLIKN